MLLQVPCLMLVPCNNNITINIIVRVCPLASLANYTPLPMFTVTSIAHAYKVLYDWS